jgi:hypothetical protein
VSPQKWSVIRRVGWDSSATQRQVNARKHHLSQGGHGPGSHHLFVLRIVQMGRFATRKQDSVEWSVILHVLVTSSVTKRRVNVRRPHRSLSGRQPGDRLPVLTVVQMGRPAMRRREVVSPLNWSVIHRVLVTGTVIQRRANARKRHQ